MFPDRFCITGIGIALQRDRVFRSFNAFFCRKRRPGELTNHIVCIIFSHIMLTSMKDADSAEGGVYHGAVDQRKLQVRA